MIWGGGGPQRSIMLWGSPSNASILSRGTDFFRLGSSFQGISRSCLGTGILSIFCTMFAWDQVKLSGDTYVFLYKHFMMVLELNWKLFFPLHQWSLALCLTSSNKRPSGARFLKFLFAEIESNVPQKGGPKYSWMVTLSSPVFESFTDSMFSLLLQLTAQGNKRNIVKIHVGLYFSKKTLLLLCIRLGYGRETAEPWRHLCDVCPLLLSLDSAHLCLSQTGLPTTWRYIYIYILPL